MGEVPLYHAIPEAARSPGEKVPLLRIETNLATMNLPPAGEFIDYRTSMTTY